jgi:hypothetical protein
VEQFYYLLVLALRTVIFVEITIPDKCVKNMQTLRKICNKVFGCLFLSGLVAGVVSGQGAIHGSLE